ncbi:MAG TPA: DUF1214 domain-containing protein [Longimicrobiaceae bacterium]|nr:DUF1214 domain-containing protein [Longimicrobiaceae bacterium]
MSNHDGYRVAYDYTVRFFPRYYTWTQFQINSENSRRQGAGEQIANRLTGPLGMGPEYKVVVAINDDTIYAEAFLDVSNGPVILTIPEYRHKYSILQLDVYGNIFATNLSKDPPTEGGTYAFVAKGDTHDLPKEFTRVELPYTFTTIAIRIDKHSPKGENLIVEANRFRSRLAMQTLDKYEESGGSGGHTLVLPLFFFAPSVKLMADEGLAKAPEAWLETVQQAMASPMTQPVSDDDRALMAAFDAAFAQARQVADHDSGPLAEIIRGAQAAFAAIINRWQSHRGPTNWIHFDNIGHWGTNYLDRAALTEYIQVGNDRTAAYYANAFVDASGLPLDGGSFAYTITFAKGELPQYQRFWSLTAYTPEYIELVPNTLDKYVVASYTRGLETADDGSLTLYVQADPPKHSSVANWLPVPKGHFSLLFRVYGPEGSALDGTYVVPKIHRKHG